VKGSSETASRKLDSEEAEVQRIDILVFLDNFANEQDLTKFRDHSSSLNSTFTFNMCRDIAMGLFNVVVVIGAHSYPVHKGAI
jgi:hypothetical protein